MLKKWIPNDNLRNIAEWVLVLVSAAVLALLVNTFLLRTANVTGASMVPTLEHADKVIVDKLSYRFGTPQYDDIVVFPFAGNPSEHYIKRVIGLPGDSIDWRDGFFLRNGEYLDDAFSSEWVHCGNTPFPIIVPEGTCFVLGDNRRISEDSRFTEVGCVPFEQLTGKVSLRYFPFSKIGVLH